MDLSSPAIHVIVVEFLQAVEDGTANMTDFDANKISSNFIERYLNTAGLLEGRDYDQRTGQPFSCAENVLAERMVAAGLAQPHLPLDRLSGPAAGRRSGESSFIAGYDDTLLGQETPRPQEGRAETRLDKDGSACRWRGGGWGRV